MSSLEELKKKIQQKKIAQQSEPQTIQQSILQVKNPQTQDKNSLQALSNSYNLRPRKQSTNSVEKVVNNNNNTATENATKKGDELDSLLAKINKKKQTQIKPILKINQQSDSLVGKGNQIDRMKMQNIDRINQNKEEIIKDRIWPIHNNQNATKRLDDFDEEKGDLMDIEQQNQGVDEAQQQFQDQNQEGFRQISNKEQIEGNLSHNQNMEQEVEFQQQQNQSQDKREVFLRERMKQFEDEGWQIPKILNSFSIPQTGKIPSKLNYLIYQLQQLISGLPRKQQKNHRTLSQNIKILRSLVHYDPKV